MPPRPLPWRAATTVGLLGVLIMWAAWQIDFRPWRLLSADTLDALSRQAERLLQPSTRTEVLGRIADAALTTLALATAGSLLALLIALALLPFTCATVLVRQDPGDARRKGLRRWAALAVHHGARLLANLLRTVPYLVWALVLLLLLGLGPLAAAVALGLHTGGVLARLFAGAVDALDQEPLRALRAAGASRMGIFLFGILPQVRGQLIALWCYRWEVNLREATVLGLVAAGGLGHELAMAFGQFKYQTVSATIIAIIILVLAGEAASSWLRRRLSA